MMRIQLFEIIDRYKVAGLGILYCINISDEKIHINDIFYDQCGNRFKVKGFDIMRGKINDKNCMISFLFENMDGEEIDGDILELRVDDE